jgi:hypothetical protein
MGQKQTLASMMSMSALPKSGHWVSPLMSALCQKRKCRVAAFSLLFDHLVGGNKPRAQHSRWQIKTVF